MPSARFHLRKSTIAERQHADPWSEIHRWSIPPTTEHSETRGFSSTACTRTHRDVRSGKSTISIPITKERSSQIAESILLNRAHWHNVYPWHTSAQRSRSTNLDLYFLPILSLDRFFPVYHLIVLPRESAPTERESVNYDRDIFFTLWVQFNGTLNLQSGLI